MPTPHLVAVRELTKQFPGVLALDRVSLTIGPGEVVAVIGENGAGKSTLMKVLAGVLPPDAGEIWFGGQRVDIDSVHAGLALGIALIHQELNLAGNLDVGANIFLGREPTRRGLIDTHTVLRESRRVLDLVGLDIDPRTLADDLPIGQQQLVEIAKALSVNARVLIMDEPTSSLSQREAENLFRVVRQLKERGVSVVYISHRLGEVQQLADRVVVLRDGRNAGELTGSEANHDTMVRLMVGRDVSQFYVRQPHPPGEVALEVRDLRTADHPQHALQFAIRSGEIVGLAGLVGAGRTELVEALFGVNPLIAGSMKVAGQPYWPRHADRAIAAGLALVPEDRKRQGLVLEMGITPNISLASLHQQRRRGGLLNFAAEKSQTTQMIQQLAIKTPHAQQPVQYLSGGNQQKVVLGKWLALEPHVLLLDEPTRGIDVGAKQELYRLMDELAGAGMAILFVSSEMEEIIGMSDRVLVMHEGRLTGELSRHELSEESIMQLATGRSAA